MNESFEDRICIRYGKKEDEPHMIRWLMEPGVLRWFPMSDLREVQDSSKIWFSYTDQKAVITAVVDGKICGSAILYISPFKKFAHQCLFAIIVDKDYRGKKIGSRLLDELFTLAKNRFSIEILHLEVYRENPAINLYKRTGFSEYGVQKNFLKESDGSYRDKIFMQKVLMVN
jgi:ribosomal protein S18 acetylase RimI-like enzyme